MGMKRGRKEVGKKGKGKEKGGGGGGKRERRRETGGEENVSNITE